MAHSFLLGNNLWQQCHLWAGYKNNFDNHHRVAAEYGEFVVGHVNLAALMNHFVVDKELAKRAIVADRHHPTHLGHATLGWLLYQFVALGRAEQWRKAITGTSTSTSDSASKPKKLLTYSNKQN